MAKEELVDDHVSLPQCQLAVEALLKHEQKRQEKLEETQLLPGKEQNVWLVLTVKQMQPEKKLKPRKIPIVHPLVDPRTSAVCLITKDPQREYKNLLEEHKIKFISRVVGVEKLKGKFKAFEARRLLLKENDLFLADERVVPLLPKLLGKAFFVAKKQPIPVNLTRKDLKGELERAISSTYFHQNQGTCSSIKVGILSHTPAQVLDNLKTALPAIAKTVKGGWDNIQSLNIKTNSSTSLPIWSCDLGADKGGRWDGLVRTESEEPEAVAVASNDDDSSDDPEAEKAAKGKGKKRVAADDEVAEDTQPKKKVKATNASPTAEATVQVKERKKQKKTSSAPATSASSSSDKPPASASTNSKPQRESSILSLPSPPRKKKARALAADFLDDAEATSALITAPSDSRKLRVILPSAPEKGVSEGEVKLKKARHRKNKVGVVDDISAPASHSEQPSSTETPATATIPDTLRAADGEKKRKRKTKHGDQDQAAAPADAAVASTEVVASDRGTTVSVVEVKQKRGASSGVEKKKDKLVKAKRSAKDALIGKKGL